MNLSFIATIVFAALTIAGVFLANLVVLVFTSSQWHVSGVLAAIGAAAASYWAQHHFTAATVARHQLLVMPSLTGYQAAADRAEGYGVIFQLVAIGLLAASAGCFWIGMR